MKHFFIFVLLVFALLTFPVQGDQYLTEARKELLLVKSRALAQTSKKEQAQNASKRSEQTNIVEQQSRPVKSRQTHSRYLGVINSPSTSRTSTAANSSRTQTQSFQSTFKNADWGTPSYSRSVQQSRKVAPTANSNLSARQDQRLATTAKRRNSVKPSRQVTTTITTNNNRSVQQSRQVAKTKKKFNWSGFFKGLGQVAEAINSGMNQTNSQQQAQQQLFQQQLRQVQQNNNALMQQNNAMLNQWGTFGASTGYAPQQIYTPNACLGTIVNGVCHGTINPSARSKTCHGKVINGRCIGTVIGGD